MRRALPFFLASLVSLAVATMGCQCGPGPGPEVDGGSGGGDETVEDAGEVDAGVDAGLQFLSRTELLRDGGVVFERVEYESGGLLIKGELCRPDDDGTVAHPVLLRNHAGWTGLGSESFDALCRQLARDGVVVASSSYRGEDGSEGEVEFCLGEVDDVHRLAAILRTERFVRADRLATIGAGHGGCIALSLAARDPSLVAVVDIAGFADLALTHRFWDRQIQYGEPPPCPADAGTFCEQTHQRHMQVVETAIGGRPSSLPLSYEQRSPLRAFGSIVPPLLMIQAEHDIVTPVQHACVKRAELQLPDAGTARSVEAYYLDGALDPTTPAFSCAGTFGTTSAPDPKVAGSLSGADTYLFIYGDQPYPFSAPADVHSRVLALRFLVDRLKAP